MNEPTQIPNQPNSPLEVEPHSVPNEKTIPEPMTGHDPVPRRRLALGVIFGVVLGILCLLFASVNVLAYLVSTGKVNIGDKKLSLVADTIVMLNPILPKTPKVLMMRSFMAHQKVTKSSVDLSMALSSDDFQSIVGGASIDIQMRGYSDMSDPVNPQFSFNGSITKDLNFDIRKKDKMLYFKVNKVPPMIYALAGIDQTTVEPVLQNWIAYDTSTLDTDAQKELQELRNAQDPETEAAQAMLLKMLDTEILPHISMTRDELDSVKMYKLEFKPSPEALDKLDEAMKEYAPKLNPSSVLGSNTYNLTVPETSHLSDVMKDLTISWWVGEHDYYIHKVLVSMKLENYAKDKMSGTSLQASPFASPSKPIILVFAASLSDFGKVIPIEEPSSSVSVEEFVTQIMQVTQPTKSQGAAQGTGNPFSQARDTQRQVDLMTIAQAISLYRVDHDGSLPTFEGKPFPTSETCIGTGAACFDLTRAGEAGDMLVPTYINSLPKDPLDGNAVDTGYTAYVNGQGVVTLSAWGEVTPRITFSK